MTEFVITNSEGGDVHTNKKCREVCKYALALAVENCDCVAVGHAHYAPANLETRRGGHIALAIPTLASLRRAFATLFVVRSAS